MLIGGTRGAGKETTSALTRNASCDDAKTFYGSRTAIYVAVTIVGFLGTILGLGLTYFACKKKAA